jgi:hypothetical protein
VITTVAPTAALVGEMLLMVGSSRNVAELVAVVDPDLTAILPALPAAGTVAVMLVGPFTVKAAAVPLNVTDVAEVKPDPATVTLLPTMPLPGVKPLFSLHGLVKQGVLDGAHVNVLTELRETNALLFDFVLKRNLSLKGRKFPAAAFETRDFFERKA